MDIALAFFAIAVSVGVLMLLRDVSALERRIQALEQNEQN